MSTQLALPEPPELKMTPIEIERLIEKTWQEMEVSKNYQSYKECWDRIDYLRELKYKK